MSIAESTREVDLVPPNDDDRTQPPSARLKAAAEADRGGSYSQIGRRSSGRIAAVAVSPVAVVSPQSRPAKALDADRRAPPPLPGSIVAPLPPPPSELAVEAMVEAELIAERGARPPISVRPAAPEPFDAEGEAESIANTFDRLFAEVKMDSSRPSPPAGSPEPAAQSLDDVRELFGQLAAQHARPIRDFLIDLKWGEASRDWLAICAPAVQALRRAAEKLELGPLRVAIDEFVAALAAAEECDAMIDGPPRDRLLSAYEALAEALPGAFALDMDHAQRESIIVQSLLLQVPDVRKVTLDRLYAAGVNAVDDFVRGSPGDLAEVAGIPLRLAERIIERFRAHKAELHAASVDAARTEERARMRALLEELAVLHEGFERASSSWTLAATEEKQRLRRARHRTLMQISVLLARLGEVARLRALERLPFERKLDELRAYLREPSHVTS